MKYDYENLAKVRFQLYYVTPALGLCSRPPLQWTLGFYEQQFPHHQLLSGETMNVMSLLWTVKTRALTFDVLVMAK